MIKLFRHWCVVADLRFREWARRQWETEVARPPS